MVKQINRDSFLVINSSMGDSDYVKSLLIKEFDNPIIKISSSLIDSLDWVGKRNFDVIFIDINIKELAFGNCFYLLKNLAYDSKIILTCEVEQRFKAYSMLKDGLDNYFIKHPNFKHSFGLILSSELSAMKPLKRLKASF